jgi:hypothetical protein
VIRGIKPFRAARFVSRAFRECIVCVARDRQFPENGLRLAFFKAHHRTTVPLCHARRGRRTRIRDRNRIFTVGDKVDSRTTAISIQTESQVHKNRAGNGCRFLLGACSLSANRCPLRRNMRSCRRFEVPAPPAANSFRNFKSKSGTRINFGNGVLAANRIYMRLTRRHI